MINDKDIGTTAYNRPHQGRIHYSGKGYDEFRRDFIRRLEENGFNYRDDDFINAFIDLTAYMGDVLMTYQNAYAQEIFLETAQLRESLFNFSMMIDYRIDPGAAAVGSLAVFAKPKKKGLLPMGFQVSGKEENAQKKVFFETDSKLNVDSRFNDFTLANDQRYNTVPVGSSLTVKGKLKVRPGAYLYFKTASGHRIVQVQGVAIDEENKKTTLSLSLKFTNQPGSPNVGDGTWAVMNKGEIGLLKISGDPDSLVYLDGKFENMAVHDPIILKKKGVGDSYGIISEIVFEMKTIKTGVLRWISENPAGTGETLLYSYKIKVMESGTPKEKTFYALEKDITETRELTRLKVSWLECPGEGTVPASYTPSPLEKSKDHAIYAGLEKGLSVYTKEPNTLTSLNGENRLVTDGDFTALEKYRPLVLHEKIGGRGENEQVLVKAVTYDSVTDQSHVELKSAISGSFTKYGVKIWGNVVPITQGKTIQNTVLGSGRGEVSYQSLDIPQAPLTHERRGREGITGAVDLRVDDLPWKRKKGFLYSKPEDRHFIIETDYAGKSRVVFGDGLNGSRLPSGKDNVKAVFSIGQGSDGNVSARVLKKPTSKPPFLKEVFNFKKTAGGSDPDRESELLDKIPVEHLTFDRAVSLSDYEDLALAYEGIGKAKAGWRWIKGRKTVYLSVTGEKGEDPSPILQDLRDHLDARRDVNQSLIIAPVSDVPVGITMEVVVLPDFDPDRVKDKILRAIGEDTHPDGSPAFFNFNRLRIGMSVHLKDIYRLVQRIAGVKRVGRLDLYRTLPCTDSETYVPAFCSDDIWIHNWELVSLDDTALDITMLQPPVNKICDHTGD